MSVDYIDYQKEPEPKKRPGCLFYGCITAIVLAVLMGVLLFLGYRALMSTVREYTDDHPETIPRVTLSEEELKGLHQRWDEFRDNLKSPDTKAETLTLTQDDLNALIDENEDLRGKGHVEIVGNDIKGQVSLPIDLPGGRRYFNGRADLRVTFDNGILIVTLQSAEVKGKPLPAQFVQGLRNQNLVEDLYKKPENAEMMRKIDSVEVKDGRIVVKTRAAKKSEAAEEKAQEGEATKVEEEFKKAEESARDEARPEATPKADEPPEAEPAPTEAPRAEEEAPKSASRRAAASGRSMVRAA